MHAENALYMRSKRARDASTREHVGQWLSPHSRQVSSRTTNFSPVVRRSVVGRRRRRTWPRIKLHLDSCIDFSFFNARLVFFSFFLLLLLLLFLLLLFLLPLFSAILFLSNRASSRPLPSLHTVLEASREDPVSRRNETGSAREEAKDCAGGVGPIPWRFRAEAASSFPVERAGSRQNHGVPWRERSSSRRWRENDGKSAVIHGKLGRYCTPGRLNTVRSCFGIFSNRAFSFSPLISIIIQ